MQRTEAQPPEVGADTAGAGARMAWWGLVACMAASAALFTEALLGWGFVDASVALVGQDPAWPGARAPHLPFDWSPTRIHQLWDAWSLGQLAQGEWPLWQPDEGLGHPLLANGQAAPLNPFKLLTGGALAGPGVAAFLVVRWLFGALGAWVLARSWALGAAPAALVAVAFAFQGSFLWHWQMADLHAWVMLPWLAWLAQRLLQAPSPRRVGALGLAVGFTAHLGHAEGALFAAAGGLALALGAWAAGPRAAGQGLGRPLGALLGALLLGVGVSAAMVLPFLDLAAHGASYLKGREASALGVLEHQWTWGRLAFNLVRHAGGPLVWPDPWTFNAWATTPALLLAPLALGWGSAAQRGGLLALGAVGLGAMAGLPPVAPWPGGIPVPNGFYAVPLLALALALAGGVGLALWQEGRGPRWPWVLSAALLAALGGFWAWGQAQLVAQGGPAPLGGFGVAVAAALALAALAFGRPQAKPWVAALVVALAWGEGAWAMRAVHPPRPGGYAVAHPAAVALRALGPVRVAGVGSLAPNLPVAWGLRSFGLMEAWMPPRLLAYWRAMGSLEGGVGTVLELQPGFSRPLARLAGLGAVLTPVGSAMDVALRARPEGFVLGGEAGGLAWHVAPAAPEALVHHRWARATDLGQAERRLAQRPEAWWAEALVEAPEGALPVARGDGPATSPVRQVGAQRWAVDLPAPGLLVVAQQHDAGWVAEVDGAPAAIWPAQVAMRGVLVPAGRHEVVMRYRPWAFRWGLAVAVGSALLALGLWLWPRKRGAHAGA